MKKTKYIYFILAWLFVNVTLAQDLDRIAQKDLLRIGGSLSTNQVLYFSDGIAARRVPYTYVYQGNLNLDFLGITSTLTFMYTNPQFSKNISNPFNTFAYHPKYKSITLHLGRISSSYSPYTLSGHLFEGGGIDYNPKKIPFTFSASFGKFQKAIEPDSTFNADTTTYNNTITPGKGPSFLRWGGGFKAFWTPKNLKLGIIGFRAKDDANSLHNTLPNSKLKPQENNVLSLNISKTLYKQLSLNGELALSSLNTNSNAENTNGMSSTFLSPNSNTALYKAFNIGMAYTGNHFTLGVKYERIDPQYKTLGTYFFNNDLENTTIDFATTLFKQKLSFSTNFGLQRDDLDQKKATNMRRLVGNLNLNIVASQRLNFNTSYSNFRTFSNTRALSQTLTSLPNTFIDTLQYRQISQNASLGYNYLLSKKEKLKQNLNGNITYQNSADILGQKSAMPTKFYNATLGYNIQMIPQAMGITLSINGSRNDFDKTANTLLGPSLAVNKSFANKKIRTNAAIVYVVSQNTGNSKILTTRAGLAYTLHKSHNFTLNAVYLNSNVKNNKKVIFKEYTLTAGYSYTFKVLDKSSFKSKKLDKI